MKTGLVLGKFAPLHIGHQFVIKHAVQNVDHLILLIYDCPEVIDIPLSTRSRWVEQLYPEIEVIEAYDGPQEVGDTPELKRKHEDFIIRCLGGRQVTHFFSSEFYGAHVSEALSAQDCRIDENRTIHPISATEIRKDAFLHRQWLDPIVYRDFVKK